MESHETNSREVLAAKGKDVAPIFKHTKGLRLECVMIDVLHTADLGVTAHILGTILWECVVAKVPRTPMWLSA